MSNTPSTIQSIINNLPVIISSLVGSIIAVSRKPQKSRVRSLVNVIGGTYSAVLFTPIIINYFGFAKEWDNGIAFVIGLIGMELCDWLLDQAQDPTQLWSKVRGLVKKVL
jgi:hypothetical protein